MQKLNIRGMTLALAVAACAGTASASLITSDPNLPPDGVYLSPDQVHAMYGGEALLIVLSNIRHHPFAATTIRTPFGPDEMEQFDSEAFGDVDVFSGGDFLGSSPMSGTGPVTTMVFGKTGNVTGTFSTEMLSMNLSGNTSFGPVMIRESPTLASVGQTTITDIGGGLYQIDSFFDVFTELSIDGGQTWMPDFAGPVRMELVPSPGVAAMLGLIGIASRRRRA